MTFRSKELRCTSSDSLKPRLCASGTLTEYSGDGREVFMFGCGLWICFNNDGKRCIENVLSFATAELNLARCRGGLGEGSSSHKL